VARNPNHQTGGLDKQETAIHRIAQANERNVEPRARGK
jgi:hypothetical protein